MNTLPTLEVTVALSEQEQRALEEIERALIAEDPRLARQASKGSQDATFAFNIRSVALILLGLCAMVGGISVAQFSLWFVALSILGFLIMFAGGLLAFQNDGRAKSDKDTAKKVGGRASAAKAKSSGGIGDKMEDSFRRRFER